jgi:hypothetical protein
MNYNTHYWQNDTWKLETIISESNELEIKVRWQFTVEQPSAL